MLKKQQQQQQQRVNNNNTCQAVRNEKGKSLIGSWLTSTTMLAIFLQRFYEKLWTFKVITLIL